MALTDNIDLTLRLSGGTSQATPGKRHDPYQVFKFVVEIDAPGGGAKLRAGCTECSGLQAQTETFEYREGGLNNYAHVFAGPTKFSPLVLKRGLTETDDWWSWYQEIMNGHILRKNGTVYLLDPHGKDVMGWQFEAAFPVKWSGPEFRADSANVAFVSIELAHRGLRWKKA